MCAPAFNICSTVSVLSSPEETGISSTSQSHVVSVCSMPNTSEGQGANVPGPAALSAVQRPTDVEEDHSEVSSLVRDTTRGRRASSAELHLPWTCPVTHSREKFYTVCSDYALLNQAASVYRDPNTVRDVIPKRLEDGSLLEKPKSTRVHVGTDGDCDMMEQVSSGNTKPILAWEIDTTDFNAVLTRKIRTSKKSTVQHL